MADLPRVAAVPRGSAFLPAAADFLAGLEGPAPLVVVPHPRAAGRLKALLAARNRADIEVVPLRGDMLAAACGVEMSPMLTAWQLRAEIVKILNELQPEWTPARRLGQAVELADVVGRLGAYGVDAARLKASIPQEFAQHWAVQGEVLGKVLEGVEAHCARVGCKVAAVGQSEVFQRVTQMVLRGKLGRRLVFAGVLDGVPSVRDLARISAAHGGIFLLPEGGAETRQRAALWGKQTGTEEEPAPALSPPTAAPGAAATVSEVVCANPWEEARAIAAEVEAFLRQGMRRIAIVSPDRAFAARVQGELAARGLKAQDSAGERLAETAAGSLWLRMAESLSAPDAVRRAALRLHPLLEGVTVDWRGWWKEIPRVATLKAWREEMEKPLAQIGEAYLGADGRQDVLDALREVEELPGMFDAAGAAGFFAACLTEAVRPSGGGDGLYLLGPLEARLMDYDAILVANAVEGVWPAAAYDAWLSPPQLRALGMPDKKHHDNLSGVTFEGLLDSARAVVIFRSAADGQGVGLVKSRFVPAGLPLEERAAEEGPDEQPLPLGSWLPRGDAYPARWSASMVEGLLACPYRAYAERLLNLRELDPLEPVPDPRVGGMVIHTWLEKAGRAFNHVDAANARAVEEFLIRAADEVLADHDKVTRALWLPRMHKLAPLLVARWAKDNRRVEAVETRVERKLEGKPITFHAQIDRLETSAGGAVVIDFKTGTPPAWSAVQDGTSPQLVLEAWLLGRAPARVEYWRLRGYGADPLAVAGRDAGDFLPSLEEGLPRLADALAEGSTFDAMPDRTGGGLAASGHCAHCALSALCRRKQQAPEGT